MARYMMTERFSELSIMPSPDVDAIEALESGWIQRQIDRVGAVIDARLAKRYAVPFGGPPAPAASVRSDVPEILEDWITAIVTARAYAKRGVNPSSGDLWFAEMVITPAREAALAVAEAANSETGLFDLPLLASVAPAGNATRGGPLAYTERSPYVHTDVQQAAGRDDDERGEGENL